MRGGFQLRFVPVGAESDDTDPESEDEIPYAGGVLDLGEAAAEQLALALDPFPRKPGAALPDDDSRALRAYPFAKLAPRAAAAANMTPSSSAPSLAAGWPLC